MTSVDRHLTLRRMLGRIVHSFQVKRVTLLVRWRVKSRMYVVEQSD